MPKAIDTNVLIRLFAKDNSRQWKTACEVLQSGRVFIANTVWLECEWVMRSVFDYERNTTSLLLRGLLSLENVECVDRDAMIRIIDLYESGFDFADAMHLTMCGDADEFITFDRKLVRLTAKAGTIPTARHP